MAIPKCRRSIRMSRGWQNDRQVQGWSCVWTEPGNKAATTYKYLILDIDCGELEYSAYVINTLLVATATFSICRLLVWQHRNKEPLGRVSVAIWEPATQSTQRSRSKRTSCGRDPVHWSDRLCCLRVDAGVTVHSFVDAVRQFRSIIGAERAIGDVCPPS